ncbi:hypothetical protein EPI10_031439 [Gossypium australe]|uniref:Uncharacterized protein n=1 Tax=Gossypium australe TaxID=47621 RepID=A0A5B6X3R2_9ROSI|nr:hypothetical protein EPI10_031439 [Gossypium australe]
MAGNPLPSPSDKGVNAIIEGGGNKTKFDVAEVKTPLRWVWKKMKRPEGMRNYCEFHNEGGHDI